MTSQLSDNYQIWPCSEKEKIITLTGKSLILNNQFTRSPDKLKAWCLVYVKSHSPSTRDSTWEYKFHIRRFLTSNTAIQKSTLNDNFRNINIGDMCQANSLDILKLKTFPLTIRKEKNKRSFSNDSLPDLKCQDLKTQSSIKLYTSVQLYRYSAESSSYKLYPREVLNVQKSGKPS